MVIPHLGHVLRSSPYMHIDITYMQDPVQELRGGVMRKNMLYSTVLLIDIDGRYDSHSSSARVNSLGRFKATRTVELRWKSRGVLALIIFAHIHIMLISLRLLCMDLLISAEYVRHFCCVILFLKNIHANNFYRFSIECLLLGIWTNMGFLDALVGLCTWEMRVYVFQVAVKEQVGGRLKPEVVSLSWII